MRKGLIYGVLLAAALLLPSNDVELGKMKPVETVSIRHQDDLVIIETDTEDMGIGSTLKDAIMDLKATTAGRIYLDTAKYLMVEGAAMNDIPEISDRLKGNVRICERKGEIDLPAVAEYLREHTPQMKLKNWKTGERLQVLESENGRMKLK